jgi:hypothetical protein
MCVNRGALFHPLEVLFSEKSLHTGIGNSVLRACMILNLENRPSGSRDFAPQLFAVNSRKYIAGSR